MSLKLPTTWKGLSKLSRLMELEEKVKQLERDFKALQEDWIKFIKNNNFGILWL